MYQQNYWQQLVHIHFQVTKNHQGLSYVLHSFLFCHSWNAYYFVQCLYLLCVISKEVTGAVTTFTLITYAKNTYAKTFCSVMDILLTTEALFMFEYFVPFTTSQNFTFSVTSFLTALSAIKQNTSVNKLNFQVSNGKFLLKSSTIYILSKISVENFFLKKLFIAGKKIIKSLLVLSTSSLIFLIKHTDILNKK